MDGNEISDVQLEQVRSDLMEALRKDNSSLSIKLDDDTRKSMQKVVMVTSPEWEMEFKSTDEVVESFDVDERKLPVPKKNYYMLQGPLTSILIIVAIMILSFVVRLMITASGSVSESYIIQMNPDVQATAGIAFDVKDISYNSDFAKPDLVKSLVEQQLIPPHIISSWGLIPGFIAYYGIQTVILLLYIVLLPFVLLIANTSKLFGMRGLEFIESVESYLFMTNQGVNKRLKFNPNTKLNFLKILQAADGIRPSTWYSSEQLERAIKAYVNGADVGKQQLKTILGDRIEPFVNNYMKRFMEENKEPGTDFGKYRVNTVALESAMDSYNLFNMEDFRNYYAEIPQFIKNMSESAFAQPVLVRINNSNTFRFEKRMYYDVSTMEYLKIPADFSDETTPKFKFSIKKNSITNQYSVKELKVEMPEAGGIQVVSSSMKDRESGSADEGEGQKSVYLAVSNKAKADEAQQIPNFISSMTRSVGVYSGFLGSTAGILLLVMLITKVLDSIVGKAAYNRLSLFDRIYYIPDIAYYNWLKRDDVSRDDVTKLNAFIQNSNVNVKIVDTGMNAENTVNALSAAYNKDVGSTEYISNQMFIYALVIMLCLTAPYVFTSLVGMFDSRLMFDALGVMGQEFTPHHGISIFTSLAFIGCFIAAAVFLSQGWIDKENLNGGKKDKRIYWRNDARNTDSKEAPMKANPKNKKDRYRMTKTWKFTTANGIYNDEEHIRILRNCNLYNARAFERSRVMFITNADSLHGFFKKFVSSEMNLSKLEKQQEQFANTQTSMQVKDNSSSTSRNLISTLGIILGLAIAFVVIPIMLQGVAESSGIMSKNVNILTRGSEVVKLLNKYVGDTLGYQEGSMVTHSIMLYIIQGITASLTLVPILTLALPSSILQTGKRVKKDKLEATELAYGELPYIDSDAR